MIQADDVKRYLITGDDLSGLSSDDIYFYIKPVMKAQKSWEDVPGYIKQIFDRLVVSQIFYLNRLVKMEEDQVIAVF